MVTGLTRRAFLQKLSLGAAGTCAALWPLPSFGMPSVGDGSVIDPPPGAAFADLTEIPNNSTVPGIVEVELEARPSRVNIGGAPANVLTYNGTFPGPAIRAKKGDILRVHLRNSLPRMGRNLLGHDREMTDLCVQGLEAEATGERTIRLPSGGSAEYVYDLGNQVPGTTGIYHPLYRGSAAEQYWGGMGGALLIDDDQEALASYETHVLFIKDIALSGGAPEPHASLLDYTFGKEGDIVTVNGQVNPLLPIRPGQVQRWKIVNACNARFLKLNLEDHVFHVIGTDGGPLDRPCTLSALLLSPGERMDVLVQADRTLNNCRLLALHVDRGSGSTSSRTTVMTVSCTGSLADDTIPSAIYPGRMRIAPSIAKTEQITLSLGQGTAYINSTAFAVDGLPAVRSRPGDHEVWEIVNQSGVDIPFHVRGNPFLVLSISGGDGAYAAFLTKTPAWKDTLIVPNWGSTRLLLPVPDAPATSLILSRILEHADLGMMAAWDIGEARHDKLWEEH